VEWVEKTGKTVDDAKERALDQLGVAESDAEVVILAEPKTGLFGRVRGEARVRARVRPAEPRPKRVRRQRDRARSGTGGGGGTRSRRRGTGANGEDRDRGPSAEMAKQGGNGRAEGSGSTGAGSGSGSSSASSRRRRRRRGGSGTRTAEAGARDASTAATGASRGPSGGPTAREGVKDLNGDGAVKEEHAVADGITLQEQAEVAREFLEGLLDRYGLEATIDVRELDEDTVELAAHGEGLGVLVGPKGATVAALQDVTRTVVQKHFPSRTDRILVDVAGYRERRIAALQRFTAQVAAEVLESGAERALEPMSAADRKVVHDAAVAIEGVTSSSQGEEPHRFVVISPAP